MIHDLHNALRSLRNRPTFTLVVVFTLGLGIATASAVFSLGNWLALRPLPGVTDQDRLVIVDFQPGAASYPNLDDLRRRVSAFSGLAGVGTVVPLVVGVEGQLPRLLNGTPVSADYFSVLGLHLAMGRPFTHQVEAAGPSALSAVISDRAWNTLFASDPHVVGRPVTVNGLPAVVVGVTPRGFHGTELLGDQDVWFPGSALWALAHLPGSSALVVQNRDDQVFTQLAARLARGATVEHARAQLTAATAALVEAYPKENATWEKKAPTVSPADGIAPAARDYVRRVLTSLMGVAALVLVLTCANVANLFLSRGVTRRGEVALRRALGGSPARLIRSQLVESVLLSAVAGPVALVLAVWFGSVFRGMTLPGGNPWLPNTGVSHVGLDWRVVGFTEVAALLVGLVVGVFSAIVSIRGSLADYLKASGATGSVGRGRLRNALVAGQLAISVALLVNALLLVRTVRNLGEISVGFDADRVTAFALWPPYSGYTREQSQTLLREAVSRVRSVPGVEDAALSAYSPFSDAIGEVVRRAGATSSDPGAPAVSAWVGPGYFRTMGIPLLAGRGFSESEAFLPIKRGMESVAVVSASQAMALFGTVDVVGRLVQNANGRFTYRVIGVAPDTRWKGLLPGSEESPLYQPLLSFVEGGTMLVRSPLATSALRPAVERAVAAVAPAVPLFAVERLSEATGRSVAEPRLLARTLSAFALLAVVLAGIGLYGVIAFSLAERTREMGIRIALGAQAGQVVAMVLRQGAKLGAASLVVGLAGALGLSRVVASRLYGVSSLDPGTYALAAVLLAILVLAASAAPALRAAQSDPIVALRAE